MVNKSTSEELCGFHQSKPASIDGNGFVDDEEWTEDGHTIRCRRMNWRNQKNCVWHSTNEKTADDIEAARRDGPERLFGAYLVNAKLETRISFEKCCLTEANLSGADLTGANLSGADLTEANLSGATSADADLTDSNLSEADLSGTNLWDANLRDADLSEADIVGAILRKSNLSGANLMLSDLSEANLRGAKLREATLRGVDLMKANLRSTDFTEAELPHADLTEADLRDANLAEATLWGINLSRATISRGTTIDKISDPEDTESALEWDRVARARHELKVVYSTNGLVSQARTYRVREQQAHSRVAKAEGGVEGYISWLSSLISRIVTGYGVQLRWISVIMILVYFGSTAVYWRAGVEDSLYYSIVTFTTSPPNPSPPPGGFVTKAVAMLETFVGTLLIVLLGYILGNREQI